MKRVIAQRLVPGLAVLALCCPGTLPAQGEQERELAAVRKQIERVERRLERQSAARDENARALKDSELQVAATTSKLAALGAQLRKQQGRQRELASQTDQAKRHLGAEQRALAEQVRVSYMTGRQELFKLLLSQDSPARLGRMMVYYDFFNRARSLRIQAVAGEIETLRGLAAQSIDVQRQLDGVQRQTRAELASLEQTRDRRATILAKINEDIAASGRRIDELKEQEKHLSELVVQLGEALAAFPVDSEEPFAELKGRLAWPVKGRVIGDYGQPRGGGPVRWNGVLLKAPQGTPVRAIYHGRVAFSDWLPGLGLLIIVDHGDGYMSLYAHNETLLKESGDWVNPGDEIAQVGDSGGRAEPSLYFEIRNNGEPENPHEWMPNPP